MAHVVIVEDDDAYGYVIEKHVSAAGHEVSRYPDWSGVLESLEAGAKADLLVVDLQLPAGTPNGLSLGRMAMHTRPKLRVIYMTAHIDLAEAAADQRTTVIVKSDEAKDVLNAIEAALAS
jgi:DNA-binding NtrC family response regulator